MAERKTGKIAKQRRAMILKAAEKAFAQNGFKGTSIQKVADLAKLPKTNVLYYFNTKMALYTTVMQEILHTWNSSFDKVTAEDEPNIALATYIAEKMEMSRINPNASKIFGLEILNGAQNFDAIFKENHKEWFNGRIGVIQSWISQGKMQEIDPEYLLYHIWGTTQHYADFSAQIKDLRGNKMMKKDFLKATNTVITLILGGCGLEVPSHFQYSTIEN